MPQSRIPGEPGIWLLIFGEMTVFAALFASFLHARHGDVAGFTLAQTHLSMAIGLANTLLLLTSSLFVAKGVEAANQGDCTRAPRHFALGLACAVGFVLLKTLEYAELFAAGIAVGSHPFFTWYFGLTALHLGHVLIGSALLSALTLVTCKPLAKPLHLALAESAGCFWHMVDLLWIVIFALIYLVE
ncbi:MAG: cytochrome c oxidase subunit 3 [Novosphingobium sp.]